MLRKLALATLVLALSAAQAQTMPGHDMGDMKEIVAPANLPVPEHMTGLGNSHIAITATPEAQLWFDQGLNEFHDFWEYESAKAFQQALRVDPNCAMCAWGLYQALSFRGGWNAYTADAFELMKRLKKNGSPKERLYIEAAVAAHEKKKDEKAIKIRRKIVELDPTDTQARIMLAWSLHDGYTDKHEPKPRTAEGIAMMEAVLKDHPDDSAANHYWIHFMEPSNHPERAIDAAKKLASLAPASGHMVHMPGHIFYRVGDYAQAEPWFAKSTEVDEAYMAAQHVQVDDDWNYAHNLMYRIDNLMQEGKLAQAATLSEKIHHSQGELAQTLYPFTPRDSMARLNIQIPVALRTGNWKEVAALASSAKPGDKLPNLNFLAGELATFANGMASAEAGDLPAAQSASTRLDAELAKFHAATPPPSKEKDDKHPKGPVKDKINPDAYAKPLDQSFTIMSEELHGAIALLKHDVPAAHTAFDKATKAEEKLGYREPPMYIRPVEETEGYLFLRAGETVAAHAAYAAAVAERPNSGFGLYGEARASEAAGKPNDALNEYAKFLAAWKDADSSLPEIKHAHEYVAAHPTMASLQR